MWSCAVVVVHPEDQRAERALLLAEPERRHHRVRRAHPLDLHHARCARPAGTARRTAWRSRPRRCRSSHWPASPGSGVIGVSCDRVGSPARTAARAARCTGARSSTSSPSASRSNATSSAGVSWRRRSTREAAGWIRCDRRSNSWTPSTTTIISPSSTSRSCGSVEHLLDHVGEVAVHRLAVAALQVHVVAVAEDDRAEAVELRLVAPARRPRAAPAPTWPAAASWAASAEASSRRRAPAEDAPAARGRRAAARSRWRSAACARVGDRRARAGRSRRPRRPARRAARPARGGPCGTSRACGRARGRGARWRSRRGRRS